MTPRSKPSARRSWYTIVGVYTDNWQKFCHHVLAVDAQQAESLTVINPEFDNDLVIVAVFKGKLMAIDQEQFAASPSSAFTPSLGMCWLGDRLGGRSTTAFSDALGS